MRRLGGFTLLRLASAILPLVVLPVVARSSSTSEWAALGVGYSVGTMAAVLIALGWSLTGPPRVAGQDLRLSAGVHRESWASSIAVACVAAPIAALVAAILAPGDAQLIAAAMTLAVSSVGVSPAWHIAAGGRAVDLALYDVLPRIGAAAVSAVAIEVAGGSGIWVYPVSLLAATVLGSNAYARRQRRSSPRHTVRLRDVLDRQKTPAATSFVGASYSALAPATIAVVASADQVAAYSSAFRLYLIMTAAIMIVNQATIHWAVGGTGASSAQLRTTSALYLLVGVGGLGFLTTVGPTAGRILFSDAHTFPPQTSAGLGVAFAALALHSFMNTHRLLPFGVDRAGLHATLLGAAVGIPSTLALAQEFGATGGAAGVAIGEVLVAAYLAAVVWRRRG